MNYTKFFLFFSLPIILLSGTAFSQIQFVDKFSIAGGPMVGWYIPKIKDLNTEFRKAGFPEISESGYLTIGGGGFVDIKNIRIGGLGTGFTTTESVIQNNINKTVKLSYGMGAIYTEYVGHISKYFDFTAGGMIGFGRLTLYINQYSNDPYYWNINNATSDTSTIFRYNSSKLTSTVFSFQPQAGIGAFLKEWLYLKLTAGYSFSLQTQWKLYDDKEVNNFPTGVKADGFNINLSLNLGLFLKDD
ncbi:MAG: hypothetical protein FJ216_02920 [Ignavibacteria bacterium]|nr:hypothetical protein [Ignavibacteria bacterium]